jgi:hypothetical protein
MPTPSLDQLKRAIVISEQIEKLQAELAGIFGGKSAPAKAAVSTTVKTKSKRTMSPEARERIAAAQRARWAKSKGEAAPAAKKEQPVKAAKSATKPKAKRNISPEARAKMAAAAKKRWALQKAGK